MEKVDDANFGCLVRIDCSGEYGEDNTVLGKLKQIIIVEGLLIFCFLFCCISLYLFYSVTIYS